MAGSRVVIDSSIFTQHLRASDKTTTELYKLPTDTEMFISSVTLYELYLGARDDNKWRDVDLITVGIPVLPFSFEVAVEAAKIYHQLRKKNKMIEFRDIFIGATAKVNGFPVKTLNKKHFRRIDGLVILD